MKKLALRLTLLLLFGILRPSYEEAQITVLGDEKPDGAEMSQPRGGPLGQLPDMGVWPSLISNPNQSSPYKKSHTSYPSQHGELWDKWNNYCLKLLSFRVLCCTANANTLKCMMEGEYCTRTQGMWHWLDLGSRWKLRKTMRKPVKKVWKRWRPVLFSKEKAKQSPCSVGK